jgi:methylenetetrahydrofolate dehydrogenase (NADP+)/methenyltetrahydrofolate cyclohydrolase
MTKYDEYVNKSNECIKRYKKYINDNKDVHGILCFRPLPKQLDEEAIKYVISPEKDVDCFSPINSAKIMEGDKSGFPPCTPTAVVEILKHYGVELKGANVAVLGRSMVVGKPAAMLLLNENATVTICHSRTKDLAKVTSEADVLVAAVGRAKMVKENFVKEGAVVIDVGINVDENGNLCGDVDTAAVQDKVSMITPVPAGVGSVTTSILAKHVVKACKAQNNK